MRVCTTCSNPARAEIDKTLASGAVVKRRLAAEYGLAETSLRRHEARHLDPRLIAAHEASLEASARSSVLTARQVILDLVSDLRSMSESMKANGRVVHGRQFLDVADRLVRANEQYGKITKELGSDQINIFLAEIGATSLPEAKNRLALTRSAEGVGPDELLDEAEQTLRMCLPRRPGRILELRKLLDSMSMAEVVESTNGGHDASPQENGARGEEGS